MKIINVLEQLQKENKKIDSINNGKKNNKNRQLKIQKRLLKVHKYYLEHPTSTKHDLICFCIENERTVMKYLKIRRDCKFNNQAILHQIE